MAINKIFQDSLIKSLFNNKLFLERKIVTQNISGKTYIFVNCAKSKTSLDFEKIGSKLYVYLEHNKIEKSLKVLQPKA